MIFSSNLNSACATSSAFKCLCNCFKHTRVPRHVPLYTTPNAPAPTSTTLENSPSGISHAMVSTGKDVRTAPDKCDSSNGNSVPLTLSLILAPFFASILTKSTWFPYTALSNGVEPHRSTGLICTPLFTNQSATANDPSLAATCKGVRLS